MNSEQTVCDTTRFAATITANEISKVIFKDTFHTLDDSQRQRVTKVMVKLNDLCQELGVNPNPSNNAR